jgi:Zn-dependent M28 family amino/carboxypeptidase
MLIRNASRLRPGVTDARLASHLDTIDPSALRGWVKWISVPRHRLVNPQENREAAEWIFSELERMGYEVTYQGPHRNVVAVPKGAHREMVLVGAHYDSIPCTPGADDNGSAVAALLGCARACAAWDMDLPVMFVAFNGEEDGLLGSTDFVTSGLGTAGPKIRCAHILEMVGYASHAEGSQKLPPGLPVKLPSTGDFLGLLTNRHGKASMTHSLQTARDYLPDFPVHGVEVLLGMEKLFPVLLRSDHAPFWAAGMPSIMWTDTSEFRNPNYHQASDTPESLDYDFLTQVTRTLTATVISQAAMLSL